MPKISESTVSRAARRFAGGAAVVGTAALLAGCGTAATTASTPAAAATTPSSFNSNLVPTTATATATTPSVNGPSSLPITLPKKPSKAKPAAKATSKAKPATSPPKATTKPAATVVKPATAPATTPVHAFPHPVTITHTVTVVRTVTAPPPAVPSAAHVPSSQPALGFANFTVAGSDIGCRLGGGAARCDIASSDWAAPPKPRSCGLAWGQGLEVRPGGGGRFVCAGDSVLDPNGPVVANGRDDRVGSVTCQVRTVGVTCFDGSGNGFYVSRTGYYTF